MEINVWRIKLKDIKKSDKKGQENGV